MADEKHEEALIIHLHLRDGPMASPEERDKIFALEDKVIKAIEESGAGEYDGNEIGEGEFTMYIYGPSTQQLWNVVSPCIGAFVTNPGSYLIMRHGGLGAKEDRVPLSNSPGSVSN